MTTDTLPAEGAAKEFTVSRIFDAPREKVFAAWTTADGLQQWFGPKGFTMLSCTLELRPGGLFHYGMRAPNGQEMWGRWVFREIAPPERVVFVASFSDEQGGVTRHPFAPDFPLETLSTVGLASDGGRTTLTLRGVPINATEAERHFFEGAHDKMGGGWAGTLDQLAAYLAKP